MKGQDLKSSILQRAIQGKLVEQRKEEGTAQELLQQVEIEREQLIKEGKIKKEKKLPKITQDEIFEIPENWVWTRLSDIADMYTGNSIPKSIKENKYSKVEQGYDYIGTKDVGFDHVIEYDNGVKIPLEDEKFRKTYKDSILMCIEGGSAGRKIGILDRTVCFGNKLCSFNIIMINPKYVYYYFQSPLFVQSFKDEMTGIIGGVSMAKLKKIVMPVPPLEEQKRIVAKIEEFKPYVDKYDLAYSEVEELNKKFPEDMQKSILQYAVQGKLAVQRKEDGIAQELYLQIQEDMKKLINEGNVKKSKVLTEIKDDEMPFDIPDNWKWVRMGEIFNIHSSKRIFAKEYVQEGIPFFRSMEVVSLAKNIEPEVTYYISHEKYNELKQNNMMPKDNDLLIACIGGSIGWTWLVDGRTFYYKDGNIVAFDSNHRVSMKYLQIWLKSPFFRNQVDIDVGGTAYNALTIDMLKNYLLPLPPFGEQKRIVEKVDQLLAYSKQLIT